MREQTKEKIRKRTKITWEILGIFILLWTFFWIVKSGSAIKTNTASSSSDFFLVGITAFAIYLAITFLFIFIKWIIKKFK